MPLTKKTTEHFPKANFPKQFWFYALKMKQLLPNSDSSIISGMPGIP
jgi:hypothetical protein